MEFTLALEFTFSSQLCYFNLNKLHAGISAGVITLFRFFSSTHNMYQINSKCTNRNICSYFPRYKFHSGNQKKKLKGLPKSTVLRYTIHCNLLRAGDEHWNFSPLSQTCGRDSVLSSKTTRKFFMRRDSSRHICFWLFEFKISDIWQQLSYRT